MMFQFKGVLSYFAVQKLELTTWRVSLFFYAASV